MQPNWQFPLHRSRKELPVRLVINSAAAGKSHLGRSVHHLSEATAAGLDWVEVWAVVAGACGIQPGAQAPQSRKQGPVCKECIWTTGSHATQAVDLSHWPHSPKLQPCPDPFPTFGRGLRRRYKQCQETWALTALPPECER